ncbi:heme utilization protein HutZ [Testudinibacter sp. TR-2022]|nr:heme utilization protein HutZ [Pasteurellaceae bacterium Phil31]TNH08654.1 heme utilization protein HutZ [Testudinibacter sp. TR-2022]TNH12963.1 heme utilization protein HutZ [Testudinibacter sp. TR-2022]TNH13436.1 heme utilization protein HutZ [Testudinibacter sp. TR-2022]TNH16989.1 heme utilization protein HutZ [Testudinibacter sp. TR-2022]
MIMTDRQERLQNRLGPEIQAMKQQCRTLLLATVDAEGNPNISYAPFVLNDRGYYVLISDVARHARNLKQVPKVSLMLIEDEERSRQIFARRRLSFDATAEIVSYDSIEWQQGTQALMARHGEVAQHLSSLQDFTLFNLIPEQGLFVKGFGQAFKVSSDDLVGAIHLQQGHLSREKRGHIKR